MPISDFTLPPAFLNRLFDGIIIIRGGRVAGLNDAAKNLLGIVDMIDGAALSQISPEADAIFSATEQGRFHFWRQRFDPATNISRRDVFLADTRWIVEEGGHLDGQLVFRDANDVAILEKRLVNTAFKDDLSGLLTGVGFVDLAETRFSRLQKDDRLTLIVALSIPDLDNYENEPVVHAGMVRDIALRMCYSLRGNDMAAYRGHNHFLVMLSNVPRLDLALTVIKRLASRVSAPFECRGTMVRMPALLGVAIHGVDGDDINSLLDAATMASIEGSLKNNLTFSAITFANKEIQQKSEWDAARAEQIRQAVLQERIQFDVSFFQSEEGKTCLICPVLPDFSEEEIWEAYESEGKAADFVRSAIERSSEVESDFFVISYPERHSKIGNNAMAMLAAERGIPLSRFFSRYPDASGSEQAGNVRIAAQWDGGTSLSVLKAAGVTLLLVDDVADNALLAAEVLVAKQFFKLFGRT